VSIGSSTNLAYHLNLPVRNAIVELGANGMERSLPGEKYYIPGSILSADTDNKIPAAWGMPAKSDIYFDRSPVFKISTEAIASGKIKPILMVFKSGGIAKWLGMGTGLFTGWNYCIRGRSWQR
jgi:hypothetical protein